MDEQKTYAGWMMAVVAFILGTKKSGSFESVVEMNESGGISRGLSGDYTYTLAEVNAWIVRLMTALTTGAPLECAGIKGDIKSIDAEYAWGKLPKAFTNNPPALKAKDIAKWMNQIVKQGTDKQGNPYTTYVGGKVGTSLNAGIKFALEEGKRFNAKPADSASAPDASGADTALYDRLVASGVSPLDAVKALRGN